MNQSRRFFKTLPSRISGLGYQARGCRSGRLLVLVLTVAMALATPAFGKNKHKHPAPPPRHDGRTVIARISANEIVTETPQSLKTYKITADTEFFYLGRRVTSGDLRKGMRVVVTPEFDGLSADKVEASDAPVPDKTPKKK